ncbi:capsular biosynthesis protein [Shinella kummerowiae]|uniref:capsular biosynthesis protein n=1 Tax=Shinella kummerowiae TaxID=417745 RepID=UPI0021B5754B|nr:capsular biosynthesis protein [Shinella kummerowiae]MCT7667674.1 capsular biosynthesis protein [Shinella kummerowiae]
MTEQHEKHLSADADGNGAAKGARLVNLALRRKLSKRFPSKSAPRVLLLQGPVGPFFRKVQTLLNESGFDAWRVSFNAGDRLFARGSNILHFSGTADAWRDWFTGIVAEHGFDYVILFGCERDVHKIAIEQCALNAVPVLCLEEGYIRPGFVTMELGGNNWLSPIAGLLPPVDEAKQRRERPKSTTYPSSFGAMATYAFTYFAVRGVFSTLSERKLFHKPKRSFVTEMFYWIKNYYLKFRNLGRNYRSMERLLEHHDKKYYLVPLQVHDDSQLAAAAGGWNNQKLILKAIVSFARNAPPTHQLVFKIHPMERGHSQDKQFIRQVGVLNNVADRVHILDNGSLGLLTRHSAGMVTINSTSGLSALVHGVPLAVLGKAFYRHPSLAFCVSKGIDLDSFWSNGHVASAALRRDYLNWVAEQCLEPGDFYAYEGMEVATNSLLVKLRSMETAGRTTGVLLPLSDTTDPQVWVQRPGEASAG